MLHLLRLIVHLARIGLDIQNWKESILKVMNLDIKKKRDGDKC